MRRADRLLLWIATLVAVDQIAKLAALLTLTGDGLRLFGGAIHLTVRANSGAVGGLGAAGQVTTSFLVTGALVVAVGLVLGYALYDYYLGAGSGADGLLVCGVAPLLANAVDRLRYGHVVDFIGLPGLVIFNLADLLPLAAIAFVLLEARWRLGPAVTRRRHPARAAHA